METWTKENIQLVEKFIEIRNRGYYVSGEELTKVYNEVLHKNVRPTQCSSCLRGRVNELEAALNQLKAKLAKEEEENKEPEPPKKTGKKTKKTE